MHRLHTKEADAKRKKKNRTETKAKAREWFQAAANQGDAEAQLYLGIMLVEGKAGQDFVTAKHWFQEAANQGIDRAQSSLHFLLSSQSSGSGHETEQLDLSYTWNKRKTKTAGGAREGSGGAREGSGRKKAEKHLWDIIHARRRQLLPPKDLLLLNSTEYTCRPYTSCHHCSEAKKKAEESCRQLRVLFYGSTKEIMTMDHSDADIIDLINDQSIPEHFKLIKHEVELGFAFTDYKVQGDFYLCCLTNLSWGYPSRSFFSSNVTK